MMKSKNLLILVKLYVLVVMAGCAVILVDTVVNLATVSASLAAFLVVAAIIIAAMLKVMTYHWVNKE